MRLCPISCLLIFGFALGLAGGSACGQTEAESKGGERQEADSASTTAYDQAAYQAEYYEWGLRDFAHPSTNCSSCHSHGNEHGILTGDVYWWSSYGHGRRHPAEILKLGECRIAKLTDEILRLHLGLEDRAALVVLHVAKEEESKSGLQLGDVLLQANEEAVTSAAALRETIEKDPAAVLDLVLVREGKKMSLEVPASPLASPPKPYRIGVQVEPPDEALRSQLNLYEDEGLMTTAVIKDSPAEAADMKVYDILLRAAGIRLSTFDDLKNAINQSEGREVKITLMRGGKEIELKVIPEPEQETHWDNWIGVHPAAVGLPHGTLQYLYWKDYTESRKSDSVPPQEAPKPKP